MAERPNTSVVSRPAIEIQLIGWLGHRELVGIVSEETTDLHAQAPDQLGAGTPRAWCQRGAAQNGTKSDAKDISNEGGKQPRVER